MVNRLSVNGTWPLVAYSMRGLVSRFFDRSSTTSCINIKRDVSAFSSPSYVVNINKFHFLLLAALCVVSCAQAFDSVQFNEWSFTPELEMRFGLQRGDNINYGLGAFDNLSEKERTNGGLSFEPSLSFERAGLGGTFFGKASVVGATNFLDGEISGQFARGGDSRIDTDEVYVGWRNESFSVSVGPRQLMFSDGFLIGDGNFDTGSSQGNYWIAPFQAFSNAAVMSYDGKTLRGDAFWLHSDRDFGDSRLYGVNVETAESDVGRYGAMFIEVYDGNGLQYSGTKSLNLRALDVPVPRLSTLKLHAEVVWQSGANDDGNGENVDSLAWYVDTLFTVPNTPWVTTVMYRYARFSGDDLASGDSENFRPLFYGFGARGWDTFYHGEIAGEYHLFNSNQVTQFIKLTTAPRDSYLLTFYYYTHDLDERHFFGQPVTSRDWADEINTGIEYFGIEGAYIYAGIAWSTPNTAAREIFGDENFTVLQTWMQFKF